MWWITYADYPTLHKRTLKPRLGKWLAQARRCWSHHSHSASRTAAPVFFFTLHICDLGSGLLAHVPAHRAVLAKCFTCLRFPPRYNPKAGFPHGPSRRCAKNMSFLFVSFSGLTRKCPSIKLQQNNLVKQNALFACSLRSCLCRLPLNLWLLSFALAATQLELNEYYWTVNTAPAQALASWVTCRKWSVSKLRSPYP